MCCLHKIFKSTYENALGANENSFKLNQSVDRNEHPMPNVFVCNSRHNAHTQHSHYKRTRFFSMMQQLHGNAILPTSQPYLMEKYFPLLKFFFFRFNFTSIKMEKKIKCSSPVSPATLQVLGGPVWLVAVTCIVQLQGNSKLSDTGLTSAGLLPSEQRRSWGTGALNAVFPAFLPCTVQN